MKKHTPNAGKGLDKIKPDGQYVLLNGWMAIPGAEAEQCVKEAREAGDNGVYAVPLAAAIAAPALLATCQDFAVWLIAPDLSPDTLKAMQAKARAAIAQATTTIP